MIGLASSENSNLKYKHISYGEVKVTYGTPKTISVDFKVKEAFFTYTPSDTMLMGNSIHMDSAIAIYDGVIHHASNDCVTISDKTVTVKNVSSGTNTMEYLILG